ncbi:TVP38/TMEM64 family protein [Gorillibacterium timonense]|uniref:TVP38/TMEM64 family protein n=1 Tax=Gorillibacterium timonense TaxID=1689269 RepID=UPI00071DDDEC|nr:VTT domain-containing protein [Gorillibacterium timonense]
MSSDINEWIEWLFAVAGLDGFAILAVTIPLGIIQGLFGVFPFATLILLHVSTLGIAEGLLASWIVGTVSALVVYFLCRSAFADWFERKWLGKMKRYKKWEHALRLYGGWGMVFLRTIPIMPNNLISFSAAIIKMKPKDYLWSNVVGNLSHIWLFGILSAAVLFPETDVGILIGAYIVFVLILVAVFLYRYFTHYRQQR